MRAFMLLPAASGLRQIEIDFAREAVDRELANLRLLFGRRAPAAEVLDATLDAEVEKLRDTHFEMATALAGPPADASLEEAKLKKA